MMSERAERWLVWVLTCVAFKARLALTAYLGLNDPPPKGQDHDEYDSYAWNLAQASGTSGSARM